MIVVSGYYGFRNLGDEAILQGVCEDLKAVGVAPQDICVLSGDPNYTAAMHGVRSVARMDVRGMMRLFRQTSLLLSGGGSLLQDATSRRSILYYLGVMELAHRHGVPVLVYAQGIGPVTSGLYQRWIARVCNRAVGVSVRDTASCVQLREWGCDKKITVAADVVYGLTNSGPQSEGLPQEGIVVNLRPYPGWQQHKPQWIKVLRAVAQRVGPIRFVPLGPGDADVGAALAAELADVTLLEAGDLETVRRVMGQTPVVLSMRLHGVVFAALGGAVPIAVDYDPKIRAAAAQLGIPAVPCEPTVDLVELVSQSHRRLPDMRVSLAERLCVLREKALENRELLQDVLKRG